jgi:hypothetical protein
MIDRKGAQFARRVLNALVTAGCAPISANDIKAAEFLFTDQDHAPELEALGDAEPSGGHDLAQAIRALGDGVAKEARLLASAKCVPLWRAQAILWFRKAKKRRRVA